MSKMTEPDADLDCDPICRELDRWSNRLARMLLRLGARPGIPIATVGIPPVEAVVTRRAIHKIGALAVPVDGPALLPHIAIGVTIKADRPALGDAVSWLVLDDRATLVQYLTSSDAPLTDPNLTDPDHYPVTYAA
jgi:hypothetical protein